MQGAQFRFGEHEGTRRQSMPDSGLGLTTLRAEDPERQAQRAMRSSSIVVGDPLSEYCTNMCLGDRNHPVEAFAPYRSDHPLADRVRFRTGHR